jgi:hypothetical protein
MRQYILKRLILAVPTLVGVSLIVFFMVRLIPGGVVQQIAGDNQLTADVRARIERDLGLDRPAYEQYFRWGGGVLKLDFGTSLRDRSSISGRLKDTLPTTLEMAVLAITISLLIALPVGIISAIRQDSIIDYIARSISIGFLAVPSFWLGTLIIVYASLWFTKATPPPQQYQQLWENPYENLKFLLFPFGGFVPVGPAAGRQPVGHRHAADAHADAGGAAPGLRADGVGEGPPRAQRGHRSRAEERDDPGGDGGRAAGADRRRRQRHRREHLQRARHGAVVLHGRPVAGLQRRAVDHAADRGCGRRLEPGGGHHVRLP